MSLRTVACGPLLCALLVAASGCATRKVWSWAGEGRYTFLPSRVTSLGLETEQGGSDRLFLRVDAELLARADGDGAADEPEYYVLEVPPEWRALPAVVVPDDIQPGDLQVRELLEAKLTAAPRHETIASLSPIPLGLAREFPPLDAAPYAFVEGPPGVLFVYGADRQRGQWIRLSSVITGRVISTPAPKFNYAIAVVATPVTVAVDAVGVVIYAILWPLWTTMDIGYEDSGDDGYRPDGRDQPGRERRELEKPPARKEASEAPLKRSDGEL